MRLLALNDQRGAALAQYETCRRALAEELNVEPAQETTSLYKQIRDGALVSPSPQSTPAPPSPAKAWSARRRGKGLFLSGIGLLALIIVAALAFYAVRSDLFGMAYPKASASPSLAEPPNGKILHLCEGIAPPQICVYETQTNQVTVNARAGIRDNRASILVA